MIQKRYSRQIPDQDIAKMSLMSKYVKTKLGISVITVDVETFRPVPQICPKVGLLSPRAMIV